jgi:hypothetical protein
MILRNATKDPKQLNAKTETGGVISVYFEAGEEKEVPDNIVKIFKTNAVCMYWFRNKVIVEVKAPKKAAKPAEVKETKTVVASSKKKGKGKKKDKKKDDFDTDLDL